MGGSHSCAQKTHKAFLIKTGARIEKQTSPRKQKAIDAMVDSQPQLSRVLELLVSTLNNNIELRKKDPALYTCSMSLFVCFLDMMDRIFDKKGNFIGFDSCGEKSTYESVWRRFMAKDRHALDINNV